MSLLRLAFNQTPKKCCSYPPTPNQKRTKAAATPGDEHVNCDMPYTKPVAPRYIPREVGCEVELGNVDHDAANRQKKVCEQPGWELGRGKGKQQAGWGNKSWVHVSEHIGNADNTLM